MSLRDVPLFAANGRPTPFLLKRWRALTSGNPLHGKLPLLEEDRSAKPEFRKQWSAAFTLPLPFGPLAEADGRGTDKFWEVFR